MKLTLVALGTLYLAACICVFLVQRTLIYPAPMPVVRPTATKGTVHSIVDGRHQTTVLHLAAPAGAPTVVHFHGNGQQLSDQQWLAQGLRDRGLGWLGVEYPGYGLDAKGEPDERNLYAAADRALVFARDTLGIAPGSIVLQGQSLGSGVAVEMASRGHGARMILISPYTSMVEMASRTLPFFPMSVLVRDRFDTLAKASRVAIPVLVLHGTRDDLIPIAMGEAVAAAIPRAQLHRVQRAGHNDLFQAGGEDLLTRVAVFAFGPSAER